MGSILNVTTGRKRFMFPYVELYVECIYGKGLEHRDPLDAEVTLKVNIIVVLIQEDQTVVLMDSLCPNLSEKTVRED